MNACVSVFFPSVTILRNGEKATWPASLSACDPNPLKLATCIADNGSLTNETGTMMPGVGERKIAGEPL